MSLSRRRWLVGLGSAALAGLGPLGREAAAQAALIPPPPARWQAEVDAWRALDQRLAPVPGGVVFIGSSTVRLWGGLEQAFPGETPVVRRGVGGSRLSDWPTWIGPLVVPHAPRLVIVYAGENDLAEGASPQDVLAAFVRVVDGLRQALPAVRVAFVSIKPSPSRLALTDAMREANLLVQTWALAGERLDYIDVHTAMLDNDGRPRPELFVRDQLHLSAEGYALWRQVISAHLRP